MPKKRDQGENLNPAELRLAEAVCSAILFADFPQATPAWAIAVAVARELTPRISFNEEPDEPS